jgi:hypothetical protein
MARARVMAALLAGALVFGAACRASVDEDDGEVEVDVGDNEGKDGGEGEG